MSGIIAVADPLDPARAAATVVRMADRLRHRPWYIVETSADAGGPVALGRVGIGIYNRAPQPARSDDANVVAVFAGRLFAADALRQALSETAPPPPADDDAALIARLYAAHGAGFAARLTGEFVAAVWDRRTQQLVVTNDRFGFYPTYVAQDQGRLLVAPEVKAIAAAPGFTKRLDLTALAQYMRFQVPLGHRTFFEDITLLPPATVCCCDLRTGAVVIEPYWRFGDIALAPTPPLADAVDECGRLLARAVNRVVGAPERPGLFLSGGLDSRLLLGLAKPSRPPLTTLTFGQAGSRDVVYAERIARRAGSRHYWFPFDGGAWVREALDLDLALSEGLRGWIHAHGISALPQVRQLVDIALTGWDGGTVVGGWRNRLPLATTDADDLDVLAAREFHRFNQVYTWPGLNEGEERVLYADAVWRELRGRAFESLRAELALYMPLRPDLRAEMFYIRNHCFRLTQHTTTLLRSHVEAVSPFFDFDLFHFLYSLPASARGYRTLQRALLERCAPRLTVVPDARDDLLPTTRRGLRRAHWILRRLATKVNAHVARIVPEYSTLSADYEAYLRGDLREWAEEILLGRRLQDRGLFSRAYLQSLWARIQSGAEPDIVGKLAPIMTYELMLRRYWDEP